MGGCFVILCVTHQNNESAIITTTISNITTYHIYNNTHDDIKQGDRISHKSGSWKLKKNVS